MEHCTEPFAVLAVHKHGDMRVYADSEALKGQPINDDDREIMSLRGYSLVPVFTAPQPLSGSDIPADPDAATIADYEAVLSDHRRLVRELDVLLNGEEGAAKQASLCDIVAQVRREGIKTAEPVVWPENPPQRKGQSPVLFDDGYDEGWAKCLEACKAAVQHAQPAEPVKDKPVDAEKRNATVTLHFESAEAAARWYASVDTSIALRENIEPVKGPSDDDIYELAESTAYEHVDELGVTPHFVFRRTHLRKFARALLARYSQSIHRDKYREAYMEWTDKTEFIQQWVSEGKLPVKYLGWHRADVMRDLIENAQKVSNLKDKFEEAFTELREDILYSRVADNMENYQTNAILGALDEMYERVFKEEEK